MYHESLLVNGTTLGGGAADSDAVANMIFTWDDGATKTLTITNTAGSYSYYIHGVLHTIAKTSTKAKPITNTEGPWWFYFDDTKTLQATQSFTESLLKDGALVAQGYWAADTVAPANSYWLIKQDERHGCVMD